MKKLREMKKNNKGFSLVELIVVIAIMVVLIAVLGSAILGYVEKSKYSKDISALDSINTAMKTFIAEPDSVYVDGTVYNLGQIMGDTMDVNGVVAPILAEVFDIDDDAPGDSAFNADSDAFDGIIAENVLVTITDGAVSICVPVNNAESDDYDAYTVGGHEWEDAQLVIGE